MKADEAVQEALTRWEETVNYVTGPELWTNLALGALKIIFILLISFLVIRIGKRVISQFLKIGGGDLLKLPSAGKLH